MSNDKKDFKTALVENTPLALVVLGLVLVLLGASGGVPKYATIDNGYARILVSILGVVVLGFGAILIWRGKPKSASDDPQKIREKYQFKITNPPDRSDVGEYIDLSGVYTVDASNPPPMVVVIEQSPVTGKYWLKDFVHLDSGVWSVRNHVGGKGDNDRILHIAVLGKNGQVLREYYRDAGTENKNWIGITTLTEDTVICASIHVRKKAIGGTASSS